MDDSSHPKELQRGSRSTRRMSVVIPHDLYRSLERQAELQGETVIALASRLVNEAIRSMGSI